MSLVEILKIAEGTERADERQSNILTEERLKAVMEPLRDRIAFWRMYPDLFIDDIKGAECTFSFFYYQRIFLRICARHRYVYATYPRAYSKSFLSVMLLIIKAVLYPGSHLFVTTGGKEQAASITLAKLEEILRLIPALNNEINWERGVTKKSKDEVKYVFKNNSVIDILAARQSSRGQRRTAGLIEEAILVDGDILNEVIIPQL